jgi:hypothetical protein
MSKSYHQSVGSGALGLYGPWHGTEGRRRGRKLTPLQRVGRVFMFSLAFAAAAGMVVGVYQDIWHGLSDAGDAGTFAYQFVGSIFYAAFTTIMTAVSLTRYIYFVNEYFLVYLQIPYQLSAFAGAFFATAGVEFLQYVFIAIASIR